MFKKIISNKFYFDKIRIKIKLARKNSHLIISDSDSFMLEKNKILYLFHRFDPVKSPEQQLQFNSLISLRLLFDISIFTLLMHIYK